MKRHISLLLGLLVAVSSPAFGWKLSRARTNLPTTQSVSAQASSSSVSLLTPAQEESVYESVYRPYSQGRISADSVVSLALYHKTGSPAVAERCLKLAADRGSVRAMTELGRLYTHYETAYLFPGKGKEGVALLERAAAQGSRDANDWLGVYYHLNNKFKQAARYFDAAGPNHNLIASAIVGSMYEEGTGYKKNPAKALEYYRQSALAGYPNGASKYGYALQKVKYGKEDYPEAFFWLYIAGDLGDDAARTNLWLPRRGQRFGDDAHTRIAQASMEVVEGSRQGSFSGEPLYKKGFMPGLKAKEQAAEQGDDWARFYLGSMNYNDDFLNRNYAQAIRYYEPIARSAKLPASVLAVVNERLAEMYREGKGVKADHAKADAYLRAAARYGSPAAYKALV